MKSSKKPLVEETLSSKVVLQGKSFSFVSDEVRLPDGRTATRNWVNYPEAVVILPYVDEEHIVLIEQYRYSLKRTIFELPAGKIDDPSELRDKAALRELLEETGYRADRIEYRFSFYPAVGYSSEVLHAYTATGLTAGEDRPDDDEFINTRIVSFDEAMEMVREGRICDSKTMLLLFSEQSRRSKI